jgi:predicted XRE-type DNA-binding protein
MSLSPELATIQALRSDMALQISRCLRQQQLTQVESARLLDIPQPTLSKIMNGRVTDLSLELLIRIAVRAGLPVVMQAGGAPEEAGAYVARKSVGLADSLPRSKVSEEAREALIETVRHLSPEQRLNAMLEQTQLVSQLHAAGRKAKSRAPARSRGR